MKSAAIGFALSLHLTAVAQGLNPPLTVRIDAPASGSHHALADPLPVRITATSNVGVASVLVAFDSNGNEVIEAPDEVRQALPDVNPNIFSVTFDRLSGSPGIRAIQAIATDSSLHTARTASRIALSPQESPPIGVSRPFEMLFGMGGITAVAVSPDGTRAVLGGRQGFAVLIDLPSGRIVRHLFGHTKAITSAAFAHNGSLAVTGSHDGKVLLWDTATGSLRRIFTHLYGNRSQEVNAVTISPDGTQLLTGTKRADTSDPTAWLWEMDSGQLFRHFIGHGGNVLAVAFSSDGQRVLTGSTDKTVRLWETTTDNSIRTFSGHTGEVQAVAFSPSGNQLLSGGKDDTARLYDVATGSFTLLAGHNGNINAVAYSPDGTLAATAGSDDTVRLWETTSGKELRVFEGHKEDVLALVFVPGAGRRQLFSSSADGTARLWDITLDATALTYTEHTAAISAVVAGVLPDGTEVRLTGSADKSARLWHAASGVALRIFSGHPSAVTAVAMSPDGTRALTSTGSPDRRVRIWDTATDFPIHEFPKEDKDIRAIGFSADGSRALVGTAAGIVKIWDLAANPPSMVATLTLPGGPVKVMAFSPDGTLVLRDGSPDSSNSRLKPATLWRLSADRVLPLRTLTGHRGSLSAATFSGDGAYVLTGGEDSTARIWEVASGAERALLYKSIDGNNEYDVKEVAFAPDGNRVLIADTTGVIRLWDIVSGSQINQFNEHTGAVNAVAFSKDGRQVLSVGADGTARARSADAGMTSLIFEGGDTTGITAIGLSSDGDQVATSSSNSVIVRLWSRSTGEQRQTLRGHHVNTRVDSIDFSPDGTRMLTGSGDGTARVWDRGSGTTLRTVVVPGNSPIISTVTFAPDSASFLTGDNKNGLYQWATAGSVTPLASFTGHTGTGGINEVAFSSPAGAQVLSGGSQDHIALLWDRATTTRQASFGHTGIVTAVAFSPDGTRILTGSDDGTAQLWDPSAPASPLQRVYYGTPRTGGSTNPVAFNSVAFAPDGRRFLTNSADGTARLWDEQGRLLRPFERFGSALSGSKISAKMTGDGRWVLTSDGSNAARLWSSATWPIRQTITEDRGISGVALAAHGGEILTTACKGSLGNQRGSARVWNAAGDLVQTLYEDSSGCPGPVALSPDDALVLTRYGNAIRLWDKGSGNKVRDFPIHEYAVYAFTFSPNGAWIATGSQEINPVSCSQNCGSVKLYDTTTGIRQHLFPHPVGVRAIAFSPDSSQLLTGSGDRLARLWDIAGETVVQTFAGHAGLITSVAFSPDPSRRWVLTGSDDQTALLWDADTGMPLRLFLHPSPVGNPSPVKTVAFDPFGARMVTTAGQTAYVWDTASGALLGAVGHKLGINAAVFSADGARLLTGGDDGTAQVWAVGP